MSEGQIVCHGPRDHALEFFENSGFKCPERKDTADFLQEVTSQKDQEQYWHNREKPYVYFTIEQFSQRFKQFHVGQGLSKELLKPYDKSQSHKGCCLLANTHIGNVSCSRYVLTENGYL
ncbi:hypothetical protein SUGI_1117810 [Cryptomeria japonica]|nr:hypothetical protein SUGI_1117810 [Cryptomeria japonica]